MPKYKINSTEQLITDKTNEKESSSTTKVIKIYNIEKMETFRNVS